jgi:hypothetical protein
VWSCVKKISLNILACEWAHRFIETIWWHKTTLHWTINSR